FTGEPLRRLDEGLLILVGARLSGLAAMAGMFVWLIHPESMRWSQLDIPLAVRWAGIPGLWVCGAWLGWMARHLGKNLTDTVNVRRAATLVTSGPYRWVRHPMYVGVAGLVACLSLITASALMLALGPIAVVALLVRTRIEEANLLERFGDDYREYRERTG